jgi:collagen type I/II/III/V/XI/XXIV/XXVII alpha
VSRTVDTKINEVIESGLIGAQVGPQGPQGVAGPVGPSGSVGLSAYEVWLSAGNTGTIEEYLVSIRGAEGLQGPAGPQGIQGEIGPMGVAGPQGTSGAQGPQGVPGPQGSEGVTGATGAQGPQGPTGPQGPQGPPGTPASGSQLILPITVFSTQLGGINVAGTNTWNRFDIQQSQNIPEGAQGAIIEWGMILEQSTGGAGTSLLFGKTGEETAQAATWMAGSVRAQGTGDQGGGGGQAFVPFDKRGTLAGQFPTTRRLWWRLGIVGSAGFYSSGQTALQNGGMYIRIIGYF